jgi:ribonuclease P protein component
MVTLNETFSKSERLCSKKAIEALFKNGKSFYCHPFLVIWAYSNSDIPFPAQIAVSVSKKNFKLAVSRNLIKRRIREAYRKNKHVLYNLLNSNNKKIVFTIIYRENSIYDYQTVENAIKQMINMFTGLIADAKSKS